MNAFADALEPRRLMAAMSTALMNASGDLTITGTAGNDRIRIINYNGRDGEAVAASSPTRVAVLDGDNVIGYFTPSRSKASSSTSETVTTLSPPSSGRPIPTTGWRLII